MPLLPPRAFAEVFEPLRGKRIGYVRSLGNVGDHLIEWATIQLFAAFGVTWHVQDLEAPLAADELVFAGGGNMGDQYPTNVALREQALRFGVPLTILPQSFTSREDRPFKRVFVRERVSWRFCEKAYLAPDLALGLSYQTKTRPLFEEGVFLRRDKERTGRKRWFVPDPVRLAATPQEYLELAARHERIITDRLHFAISGLIVGRETTLLANAYHKNAAMHEAWLGALGCRFAASLSDARNGRHVLAPSQSRAA